MYDLVAPGSWSERRLEDPSQLVCCWSRWHCNGEEHRSVGKPPRENGILLKVS